MLIKTKILIVDDIEINRMILSELFAGSYEILEAADGVEALECIEKNKEDLAVVLLDIVMPKLDGFGVLKSINESELIKSLPVIFITGENDDDMALRGYDLGVSDLIHKPFNSDIVLRRVHNVIDLFSYKNNLEEKVELQMNELKNQEERIKGFNLFLIDALSTTVEFRSFEAGEQMKRMQMITGLLLKNVAEKYSLSSEQIEIISSAAALHDIGKIAISDDILLKPGVLTKNEFDIMKTHTLKGCEILDNLSYFHDREYYKYCYDICKYHHEKWDGNGYPDGLVGDKTPIWSQAASIADAYEALTSKRVYCNAYSHEEAVRMILGGECGKFNPVLIESFLKIGNQIEKKK